MSILKVILYDYPLWKGRIFDNLSKVSLDLLKTAQKESKNRDQPFITSLCLLSALYYNPCIRGFLEARGLVKNSINNALEHSLEHKMACPAATIPGFILPLSDKLQEVIIEANHVAMEAERSLIRPEDLLIGLLRECTNEAAFLLTRSGIRLHKIYHHFNYPQRRLWHRLRHWLGLL